MSLLALPQGIQEAIKHVYQASFDRWAGGIEQDFSVEVGWKDIIGQWGIQQIAKKLEETVKFKVLVHHRGDSFVMEPIPVALDQNDQGGSGKGVGPGSKVPRPPNAFILYRQHLHEAIKAKYPGHRNIQLSQIIGAKWKSEPAEVREHFSKLAQLLKEEHAEMFPGYAYQPRKASEKKRRMTAKKAAKVEAFALAIAPGSNAVNDAFVSAPAAPVLAENPFGNFHMTLDCTFGEPTISPRMLHNAIRDNNQKFMPEIQVPLPNIAPILAASPGLVLEKDIENYERLRPWTKHDGGHALGAKRDREYHELLQTLDAEELADADAELYRQLLLNDLMLFDHTNYI